jgi:hypothetical protein
MTPGREAAVAPWAWSPHRGVVTHNDGALPWSIMMEETTLGPTMGWHVGCRSRPLPRSTIGAVVGCPKLRGKAVRWKMSASLWRHAGHPARNEHHRTGASVWFLHWLASYSVGGGQLAGGGVGAIYLTWIKAAILGFLSHQDENLLDAGPLWSGHTVEFRKAPLANLHWRVCWRLLEGWVLVVHTYIFIPTVRFRRERRQSLLYVAIMGTCLVPWWSQR